MIIVGLDVGRESHRFHVMGTDKRTLKTGALPNETWAYEGWATMVEALDPQVKLFLESINGYSSPLDQFLIRRGWSVVPVTAIATHAYRETVMRQHNKTDGTDAEAIAHLGLDASERFSELSQPRLELRRLTRWRAQLVKEHTRSINRLRRCIAEY